MPQLSSTLSGVMTWVPATQCYLTDSLARQALWLCSLLLLTILALPSNVRAAESIETDSLPIEVQVDLYMADITR